MAFNPLANFAKYKRFWMGLTMILVMVTFVLCTGKGDMGEILMRTFQFGRSTMFRIDGTNVYREDFNKLQTQRKVANEYMYTYSRMLSEALQERLRNAGDNKNPEDKENFTRLAQVQKLLTFRKQNAKYFDSAVPPEKGASKNDELIDFRVWLAEADRLGIHLQPKTVQDLINADLLKYAVARDIDLYNIERAALQDTLRNANERVNDDFVFKALENEYRVRIAQLADCEFQIRTALPQLAPIKRVSANLAFRPEVVRTPMSPGILWDYFQANRREFSVALMPVPASEFVAEIAEPDAIKLQTLFEKNKKDPYDPASPKPGFLKSHQIKVQYVTADVNSPFYKKIVNVADVLAQYPIGSFVPQMPLATALTVAAGPTMFDTMLQQDYLTKVRTQHFARIEYLGGSTLGDPTQAPLAYLARKDPVSIAAMVGSLARPAFYSGEALAASSIPAFLTRTSFDKKDAIKAAVKSELKTLVPVYATVVASGTMPTGLLPVAELLHYRQYLFVNDLSVTPTLPYPLVKSEMQRDFDLRFATKIAMANMAFFKKEMEVSHRVGDKDQVDRLLKRYGPRKPGEPPVTGNFRDLGLEVVSTDKFYDRYSIKDAPELKPLLEAYQTYYTVINAAEGRETFGAKIPSERVRGQVLKDDDFWRIFFDAEPFALQRSYEAKPWPPVIKLGSPEQIDVMFGRAEQQGEKLPEAVRDMRRQAEGAEPNKEVTFNLFAHAERPILFWKIDDKKAAVPEKLDEVKDRVVAAWKLDQARDVKVLPFVKKLAESMISGQADYKSVLQATKPFNKDIIVFDRLAPTYRDGRGAYGEFKLSRDVINFPREDMVAQLLSLAELKEPIKITGSDKADKAETPFPALDALNDELFKLAAKNNRRVVQILTNKPRDTFYVAVVDLAPSAKQGEFFHEILPGAAQAHNLFFERAQDRLGDEHYRALMVQLRKDHRVSVEEEAKKDVVGDQ